MAKRKAKNGDKCSCCGSSSSSSSSSGSSSGSFDPSFSSSSSSSQSESVSSSSSSGSSSGSVTTGRCCGINPEYVQQDYRDTDKAEVEDWLYQQKNGREMVGFLFHGPVWLEDSGEWYGALICLGQEASDGGCDCAEMKTGLAYVCIDGVTGEQCANTTETGFAVPGTQVWTPDASCSSTQEGSDVVEYDGCDGLIDPCEIGCPQCTTCNDLNGFPTSTYSFDENYADNGNYLIREFLCTTPIDEGGNPQNSGPDSSLYNWKPGFPEPGYSYAWIHSSGYSEGQAYENGGEQTTLVYGYCSKYRVYKCDPANSQWVDVTDNEIEPIPGDQFVYDGPALPDCGGCQGQNVEGWHESQLDQSYTETFVYDENFCETSCTTTKGCDVAIPDIDPSEPEGDCFPSTIPIPLDDSRKAFITKEGKGKNVETRSLPAGPGTELKKLLGRLGLPDRPGCKCNKRAKQMDQMEKKEPGWCENHLEEIVGWLREEAVKRKLPFVDWAAKIIVRRAIRNAKRAT